MIFCIIRRNRTFVGPAVVTRVRSMDVTIESLPQCSQCVGTEYVNLLIFSDAYDFHCRIRTGEFLHTKKIPQIDLYEMFRVNFVRIVVETSDSVFVGALLDIQRTGFRKFASFFKHKPIDENIDGIVNIV